MRVLVTNGTYHNTLAMVRALSERGYGVHVGSRSLGRLSRLKTLAFASRHCLRRHTYMDPHVSADAFVADIAAIAKGDRIDVLLPVGVDAVLPISRHLDELRAECSIPLPDADIVATAHDKERTLTLAECIGLPIPRTISLGADMPIERAVSEIGFPMVVKPRKGAAARGVSFLDAPDQFERLAAQLNHPPVEGVEALIHDMSRPLIQERIFGRIHDVCLIAHHGRVLASLTQERLKMYPTAGGSGIVNRTTDVGPLKAYAQELVKALSWHGVAQIEFIQDTRTGEYKLMEFNPKFWGTLALSIAAGLDFPHLACRLATGQAITTSDAAYKVGVVYRWRLPHEIMAVMDDPRPWSALKSLVTSYGPETYTDFRWSDPLPTLLQAASTPTKAVQALKRRRDRRRWQETDRRAPFRPSQGNPK